MMTDMIRVHLIRHVPVINPGKIWYGDEIGIDLTSDAVRARFNELAKGVLGPQDSTLVYASSYKRAQQTAQGVILSAGPGFAPAIIIEPGFTEQQYGAMTGRAHNDIRDEDHVRAYLRDMWDVPPKGGESLKMFQERIAQTLDKTMRGMPGHITHVAVFCHGGVQMAALAHIRGLKMHDLMRERKETKDGSLDFSYMSSLTLAYRRGRGCWLEKAELDPGLQKPAL